MSGWLSIQLQAQHGHKINILEPGICPVLHRHFIAEVTNNYLNKYYVDTQVFLFLVIIRSFVRK